MHPLISRGRTSSWLAIGLLVAACDKDNGKDNSASDAGENDGAQETPESGTSQSTNSPAQTSCTGLQCQQQTCEGGKSTTISGKVYDPAGKNPLYNVVVYVPNAELAPLPPGASCAACDSLFSGSPVAVGQTDATGQFTIKDVPVGDNIPLVMQVGKWRRKITIASVAACQDNPQPDKSLRLPRNRSEGDLPNIAISTGAADTLECLLRRVGVDASEYVAGAGGAGRVHIFLGSGRENNHGAPNTSPAAPSSASTLWTSAEALLPYDIVLLSCEGAETARMNQQALHDYASAGGRVFASHFHYAWFNTGPYGDENLARWRTGAVDLGAIKGDIVTKLPNGEPFPKGQALLEWLGTVGALQSGQLPIEEARYNATVSAANLPSQPWIVAAPSSRVPGAAQYFSFNTPTDAAAGANQQINYCGRVVYSDLHVGAASRDVFDKPVPSSCADLNLSPQEAALEFMLFDLSSCVVPDSKPPTPPVILF